MKIFKLFIYFLFLSLLSLGCFKDEPIVAKPEVFETIEIQDLIDLLPDELLLDTDVVFKNAEGAEQIFETRFLTGLGSTTVNSDEYTHEQLYIGYSDPEKEDFLMDIRAAGFYSSDDYSIQKNFNISLMPLNAGGGSCVFPISVENNELFSNAEFHESLELLGRNYANVFIGKNYLNTYDEYTEVMMSIELGIMAFRDQNNELWSHDRLE